MLTTFLALSILGTALAVAYLFYTSLAQTKAINELGAEVAKLKTNVTGLQRIEEIVHPSSAPEREKPRKRKRTRP